MLDFTNIKISRLAGESDPEPVALCHMCEIPCDRLSKCRSKDCHLILVVCPNCEDSKDPRCCVNCLKLDSTMEGNDKAVQKPRRPICVCEKERELQLWGSAPVKQLKQQGWRKRKKGVEGINIQFKTVD